MPAPVRMLESVSDLGARLAHTCALTSGGEVWCWGSGFQGALGDGTWVDRTTPVRFTLPEPAIDVAVGAGHSCAVLRSGAVVCTPYDGSIDPAAEPLAPHRVPGVTGAVAIAAGEAFTCALLASGAVWCWGENDEGQLGRPSGDSFPMPVEDLPPTAVQIAAGARHACARLADGAVYCWGSGDTSPPGDGTLVSRIRAVRTTLPAVTDVAAGGEHTCAIATDARVLCWGDNLQGALGDGTRVNRYMPAPVAFAWPAPPVDVEAGRDHTCARTSDGRVWCWGANRDAQLGLGSAGDALVPAEARPVCDAAACDPTSCVAVGAECGTIGDGCGRTLDCGGCAAGMACGSGGAPNRCGPGCTPITCAAAGVRCGRLADGCGGTLECGSCTAPATCGGGGTPGRCGCTPLADPCGARDCGTAGDGCGATVACGTCRGPYACGGGGSAGVCGCDRAGWTSEIVDETGVQIEPKAVFAAGQVHVAYVRTSDGGPWYARRSAAAVWTIERISDEPTVDDVAIAADSTGGMHVAYDTRRAADPDLRYAYRAPAGGWTTETVDTAGSVGIHVAIGVDAAGTLHILYYDFSSGRLKHAMRAGGVGRPWTIAYVVPAGGRIGIEVAMTIDSAGAVHASYLDDGDGLRYAHRPAGAGAVWRLETPIASGGYGSAIAVDAAGGVHISHTDFGFGALRRAYRAPAGGWTHDGPGGAFGVDTGLALDARGGVHVSYDAGSDPTYAYRLGEAWQRAAAPGQGPIFVDAADTVHVVHTRQVGPPFVTRLEYARTTCR